MVDVDGDQSTNDTVLLLANGAAGGERIDGADGAGAAFQDTLNAVCTHLAKELVRDGEGAGHVIEVNVDGAQSDSDARRAGAGDIVVEFGEGDGAWQGPELGQDHDGGGQERDRP